MLVRDARRPDVDGRVQQRIRPLLEDRVPAFEVRGRRRVGVAEAEPFDVTVHDQSPINLRQFSVASRSIAAR